MRRLLIIYNLLLPFAALVMLPSWTIKMIRRGGMGTGLRERVGLYRRWAEEERKGGIYIHAVSVGEVQLAKKLIETWQRLDGEAHFVLVPTTATGHFVAKQAEGERVRVIYSPLDFQFLIRRMLKRFEPSVVVLMESELWPNLVQICAKRGTPVNVANARLSERSGRRYAKLAWLLGGLFERLGMVCVPELADVHRWTQLGVPEESVVHTGSVKFDQKGAAIPTQRAEFSEILAGFEERTKVLLSSTHMGEEKWLARIVRDELPEAALIVVPRHEERRTEVQRDLKEVGIASVLRSNPTGSLGASTAFVVDVTGELRDWTAHADIVIIGKSWLAEGGQSPVEAIAARKPVIVGKDMRNFASITAALVDAGGVMQCAGEGELRAALHALRDGVTVEGLTSAARRVLDSHEGATERTVQVLRSRSADVSSATGDTA